MATVVWKSDFRERLKKGVEYFKKTYIPLAEKINQVRLAFGRNQRALLKRSVLKS